MALATIRNAIAILLIFGVAGAQARDAASGLPSGKRQHKPITVTNETDTASPKLGTSGATQGSGSGSPSLQNGAATTIGSQTSGAGAGKVTLNPFSITRKIDTTSPKFWATASGRHKPKKVSQ
jgi:type VI protein secretion system component Hcp